MKKVIFVIVLFLSCYVIYNITEDNRVNYMALGDGISYGYKDLVSDYLFDSEKRRCDHLERYSDSFIDGTDQDAGLWDFWTDEEPEYGYSLSQELIAHNPKDDAKKNVNRVIAIDFGTSM